MSNNRNRHRRPAGGQSANGALVHLTTPEVDPYAEREPLFTIDGTVYTIPVRVPASAALEYIEYGGGFGSDASAFYALRYALGDAGYEALKAFKALDTEDFGKILDAVRAKFDGVLAGPKAR